VGVCERIAGRETARGIERENERKNGSARENKSERQTAEERDTARAIHSKMHDGVLLCILRYICV